MRVAHVARALAALVLSAALLAQLGCSGGSGTTAPQPPANNGTNTPPPPPLLRITTFSLPNAILSQPYSQMLQASGGTPPYIWSTYGPCPAGISLSAAGLLSGTPTNFGVQACFVQVTDSGSHPQTGQLLLTVFVEQPLTLSSLLSGPVPSVRHPYSANLSQNGGFGPYTWAIQSGSLPPGVTLSPGPTFSSGTISGVPTTRGTYTFTVQVTDTGPPQQTTTQAFSLTVFDYPEIRNSSLPVGLINYPYNVQLEAIGGTPPYSWSTGAGELPPGITLDPAAGTIGGTPTLAWNLTVGLTVMDSQVHPLQSTSYLQLVINPPLTFTSSTLPDAVQTRPYTYGLPFQGGLPPYTITVPTGALPASISVPTNSAVVGTFSGSPSALGTSNFTLSVQDSESPPSTIQQAFSIRVNPQLVLQNVLPPPGAVGLPYSFQFQVTGGLPPLHWLAPITIAGLTVDPATGLMSGTPTESGPFSFAVSIQDSSSPYQTSTLEIDSFRIYDRLRVATSVLPPIAPNSAVNMHLGGFGGTGNYVWSVGSGTLPNGLNLSSNGQLSGQATQAGSFPVTLQLSDVGPPAQTASLATTIKVSGALGRNDTPATATPLSNGTYYASISPFSDPPTGVGNPDSDFYVLAANPGATVTIEIRARRLNPPNPLDSVLEIVDSSNHQLSFCSLYAFGPFFNGACVDDDLPDGSSTDSILYLQVPQSNSGPLKFYAHVLDFRGDARPDFIYTITVTGAN